MKYGLFLLAACFIAIWAVIGWATAVLYLLCVLFVMIVVLAVCMVIGLRARR